MLGRAMKDNPEPDAVKLGSIHASRHVFAEARIEDLKDIWNAIDNGFFVYSLDMTGYDYLRVGKDVFDWESGWARLNQIIAFTEDEFLAEMQDQDGGGGETDDLEEEIGGVGSRQANHIGDS